MKLLGRSWLCVPMTAFLVILGMSAVCAGALQLDTDFEVGLGQNTLPIGSSISGLTFSSFDGDGHTSGMYFADITSGIYSVTSDNGDSYGTGDYFVSGNVAAFIDELDYSGKIAFTQGAASAVKVGYSSYFAISLDGYDIGGNVVATASGAGNTSTGSMGWLNLTSTQNNISYVVIRGAGSGWMIDNVSSDAVVPEPGTVLAALSILGPAGIVFRRMK